MLAHDAMRTTEPQFAVPKVERFEVDLVTIFLARKMIEYLVEPELTQQPKPSSMRFETFDRAAFV
ncbi:hypothetical protein XH88_27155 [Bradyrhizobium sp. CCBAU 51627]|nr:hypothetical protein [Bradyrhizobium sp. CCBAU 51627]RXH25487.1 hypothetical protein XH84_31315 [Bradyrhizobium nanningense]